MNAELRKIISEFQNKVEEANELLKLHLKTDEPHNWSPPIEQVGLLGGKHKYFSTVLVAKSILEKTI